MNTSDFCYWLHGFFEIDEKAPGPSKGLNAKQVDLIKKHLQEVFIDNVNTRHPVKKLLEDSGTISGMGGVITLTC